MKVCQLANSQRMTAMRKTTTTRLNNRKPRLKKFSVPCSVPFADHFIAFETVITSFLVLQEIIMVFKTWLEAIVKLPPYSAESVIREAPRTRFVGDLPPGFEFLKGAFTNLGYENLGLPPAEVDALNKAILGTGLAVAGTQFRFRTERGFHTIIESADGSETASLPADWKQAVYVFDIGNDKYTWIGKKIPPDQMRNFDRNLYDAEPDGFSLKRVENLP
jgi:hypothetical protein